MRTVLRHDRKAPRSRGFTLIEAAMVTVIVGLSILALVELLGAGSMANAESTELTIGVNLAVSAEEMLQGATYSTLFANYDDRSYSPPVDCRGVSLSSFSNWSQTIDIKYLDPANLTSVQPDTTVTDSARVTVSVSHNGNLVYSTSWIAVAP